MARSRKKETETPAPDDKLERIRTGAERKPPVRNPLDRTHLQALNTVIEECTNTANMCAGCIDAGVDLEPEQKINQEQLLMAQKLKALFFPNVS